VTGPRTPAPTVILSTDRIGVISAAVPTKKTSSARYSISRGKSISFTGKPTDAQGREGAQELHDKLNAGALTHTEEWPYMPHLTIVKMSTEVQAEQALVMARDLWAEYRGSRRIQVKELTFVREEQPNCWKDLAGITLGRTLVSPRDR